MKSSKLRICKLLAIGFALILVSNCKKDDDKTQKILANIPVITTTEVTLVTNTTATCGGNVTDDGGAAITERGICYSTAQNPTVSSSKVKAMGTKGTFTCNMTELTAGTTYYVNAYATNTAGTAYGTEVSFTTSDASSVITDICGNVYNTITIGTQTWMKENLKTHKYRDGTYINNITDNTAWSNLTTGGYCWYNNDVNNKDTYGALYNHFVVEDSRNLCPSGWHIPTDEEWNTLTTFLGGQSVAGGKLKSNTLWTSPNTGADNSSGFSAVPGGYRLYSDGTYSNLNTNGMWWSSTIKDAYNASYFSLNNISASSNLSNYSKKSGFSVRCIKD